MGIGVAWQVEVCACVIRFAWRADEIESPEWAGIEPFAGPNLCRASFRNRSNWRVVSVGVTRRYGGCSAARYFDNFTPACCVKSDLLAAFAGQVIQEDHARIDSVHVEVEHAERNPVIAVYRLVNRDQNFSR